MDKTQNLPSQPSSVLRAKIVSFKDGVHSFNADSPHFGQTANYYQICISSVEVDVPRLIRFKVFCRTTLGRRLARERDFIGSREYIFTLEYSRFIRLKNFKQVGLNSKDHKND